MPTVTITNEIIKYIDGLSATHPICVSFGNTFTAGDNLYEYTEPLEASECLTLIPYGGAPPNTDKQRHETTVQIRLKARGRAKSVRTMQSIINALHDNTNICASVPGIVIANQSAPFIMSFMEGGELMITVANFTVRHVKLV